MSNSKYEDVKLLADDNNGVTVSLVKAAGNLYVLKSISEPKYKFIDPKSEDYLPSVSVVEKQVLTEYGKINSPYLVKYVDSYAIDSKKSFNYVSEYCLKGDIFSLFADKFRNKAQIPLAQLKTILAQLVVGLYTLHSKKITHGNIKIDNIYSLNDEGDKIKLGGFGTVSVSYNGLPPEIRSNQQYSLKTDVFGLGYVLQQLFSSQPVVHSFGVSSRGDLPEALKNLVAQMLSENPNNRPTLSQIVQNADVKDAILTLLPKDTLPAELLAEYNLGSSKTAAAVPAKAAPAPASAPVAGDFTPFGSSLQLKNEPGIKAAIAAVTDDKNPADFLVLGYTEEKDNGLELVASGSGGLEEIKKRLSPTFLGYAYLRVVAGDQESKRPKFVQILYNGKDVPGKKKGKMGPHKKSVEKLFQPQQLSLEASTPEELSTEGILKTLQGAGANYDSHRK